MKPGRTVAPPASITRASPAMSRISAVVPTASIRPPVIASASASGPSIVISLPLRMTISGIMPPAWNEEPAPDQTGAGKHRTGPGLLLQLGPDLGVDLGGLGRTDLGDIARIGQFGRGVHLGCGFHVIRHERLRARDPVGIAREFRDQRR